MGDPGSGPVLDAGRLVVHGHQFLHVVDRALQIADVDAHVAQIALQHEERGQHERDIAGARGAGAPEQQPDPQDRGAQQHERRALTGTGERAAHPGAPRPRPPFADYPGEPRLLARLRPERLDHRVAADGIGECAAHPGIPGVGKARRGRHIAERQPHREQDVEHRAEARDQPHHRPEPAEQQRGTHQHHHRWHQGDQQRVVEQVEREHAAGDLAHRGASEGAGVPVRRKPLHVPEGIRRDLRHHPEREGNEVGEGELAHDHATQPQRHQDQERLDRRLPARGIGTAGHRFDEPAGIERRHHVRDRRREEEPGDAGDAQRLALPMPEGEAEHAAEGVAAQVDFGSCHDLIRQKPVPSLK